MHGRGHLFWGALHREIKRAEMAMSLQRLVEVCSSQTIMQTNGANGSNDVVTSGKAKT